MTKLNPRETTPLDGTRIIIFFKNGDAARIWFHEGWIIKPGTTGVWRTGSGHQYGFNINEPGYMGWIKSPEFEEYC